jgi:hypothetical protein
MDAIIRPAMLEGIMLNGPKLVIPGCIRVAMKTELTTLSQTTRTPLAKTIAA